MTSRYARWDGPRIRSAPTYRSTRRLAASTSTSSRDGTPSRRCAGSSRKGCPGSSVGSRSCESESSSSSVSRRGGGRISDPLEQFRQRLEEVQRLEREALADRLDDDARFAEMLLDALPDSPTAQVNELRRYEFASSEAEQAFAELLEEIRRQVLDSHMRGMTEAMRNPDPEQMARLKDMVADLNAMLERRAAGDEPTQEQFDDFMRRHGEFFPRAAEEPR